ncbi:hypothetical protein JOH51_006765 [Rhizobium leguminosarum]|nr:hypothetical protein [Rhizobium leguminosarum]
MATTCRQNMSIEPEFIDTSCCEQVQNPSNNPSCRPSISLRSSRIAGGDGRALQHPGQSPMILMDERLYLCMAPQRLDRPHKALTCSLCTSPVAMYARRRLKRANHREPVRDVYPSSMTIRASCRPPFPNCASPAPYWAVRRPPKDGSDVSLKRDGSARGGVGYALDRTLIYGTGGWPQPVEKSTCRALARRTKF